MVTHLADRSFFKTRVLSHLNRVQSMKLTRNTKEASGLSDEYGTPQVLFDIYNQEFKFVLDVCASDKNHKCQDYWTKKDDGLVKPWIYSNWCNPPYSNQLPWVQRAVCERDTYKATTVLLMKYDPSTRHGVLISEEADEIRIVEHRIRFEGATLGANFPSAFCIIRPRPFTRKAGARVLYVNYRAELR